MGGCADNVLTPPLNAHKVVRRRDERTEWRHLEVSRRSTSPTAENSNGKIYIKKWEYVRNSPFHSSPVQLPLRLPPTFSPSIDGVF